MSAVESVIRRKCTISETVERILRCMPSGLKSAARRARSFACPREKPVNNRARNPRLGKTIVVLLRDSDSIPITIGFVYFRGDFHANRLSPFVTLPPRLFTQRSDRWKIAEDVDPMFSSISSSCLPIECTSILSRRFFAHPPNTSNTNSFQAFALLLTLRLAL